MRSRSIRRSRSSAPSWPSSSARRPWGSAFVSPPKSAAWRSTWCGPRSRCRRSPAWPSTGLSRLPSVRRRLGTRPTGPRSAVLRGENHMRTSLAITAGLLLGASFGNSAAAADKGTLQLKWVTQAQFAGYYRAKSNGFYKDADLDVAINPCGPDVGPPPLIQKRAECVSPMTYKEYWQGIDAGYKPSQLVVFKYEDEGVGTMEDGLYVLENKLADGAFVAKMATFVKASMKGWDYAKKNVDEATKIVLAADTTGAETEKHQKRMMGELAKLRGTGDRKRDPAHYDRTVSELMSGGSDPVITKKPVGAWTHKVYEPMN